MKKNHKRLLLSKETLRKISSGVTAVGVGEVSSIKPAEPVKTEKTWACDTVYDCTVTYRVTCV